MIAGLLALAAAAAAPGNLCAMCHPDVRVQYEGSVHHAEEVPCVACHGGNPTASTVAAAHASGFRGKLQRRDIPQLCASCHADPARMRPYNLPTDQLALYRTSRHGLLVAKGDDKAAVCTDCHGVHDILGHSDPRSSVSPLNTPATCGRCHADPALMRLYGWSEDPLADFRASVHGVALQSRQDGSAPGCSRCHGSHGAAPPGVGDVDKVCGQCHAAARDHFLEGPHRHALRDAGLYECASCHGHHLVKGADTSMLYEVCSRCHGADSEEVALARRMKTLIVGAGDHIDQARRMVQEAAAVPLYTQDYEARLEEARTWLLESLPATHAIDLARIEQMTGRASSISEEIDSEVRSKMESLRWRRLGLAVFWFYLLLTVAILMRYRNRAAREAGP